jgi:UDP-N-acetylglucosamine 2-epimerase (non-hydrolysing)
MKIAFIIGTRPEIIKMAPIIDLSQKWGIDYVLIHTGQHYDHEMSQRFFLDLELEKPHYNIGVGSNSHGKQTAQMIEEIEKVLTREKPDIVLVQGDTNAVLAGAVAASKLNLAVGHVEAGLRSFDRTMPEEINRKIADSCSTMYFVPTEESAVNLALESVDPHEIFVTGNTVVDACVRHLKIAEQSSKVLSDLDVDGDILTLTMHRAENVDDPERLKNILDALMELQDITVVFPVHPRTLKTLENFGYLNRLESAPHIKITKPIGYLDFLLLLSRSKFVMTDSGGLQEEAITLNIPCITLRYNTERPETVSAGGNVLVGSDKDKIIKTIQRISGDKQVYRKMQKAENPYGDGSSSEKILKAVLKHENEGKFNMSSPDNIMKGLNRSLVTIRDDLSVNEYETINPSSKIQLVFQNEKILFPFPELSLKDRQVLLNKY